ncbi:hypothetical protein ACQEUV_23910 [Micromonospora aurantiaca (nom. illeg.)]|uniref:hypothetical protein n=1 Tax=Micromonospora aurantiaca (nom. illeg.) TaxID=47850 RepID=UPI003DA507D9
MSRELHRYYRSLAADTDERVLPAPDRLRRSADRWARRRAAITVLAAAGLVAGTVAGSRLVLAAGPGPVPVPPPRVRPPRGRRPPRPRSRRRPPRRRRPSAVPPARAVRS